MSPMHPMIEKSRPQLKLFGFDVHFRMSVLLAAAAGVVFFREIGALVAITLILSVLVHELGHSLAFRRYGSHSHIVVHLFGGYSLPHSPQKLSHRAWVIIAAAGPLGAFLLLGVPALVVRFFDPFGWNGTGYGTLVANVFIWFNVIWGLANLAPVWPLDGGRILYHGTKGNWQLTRTATVAASAIGAAVAWQWGYVFVAGFLAFNAVQVWQSRAPQTMAGGGGRVGETTEAASRFSDQPTATRGGAGERALDRVYMEITRGRHDRAAEPLQQLMGSEHRPAAEEASAWGRLLQGIGLQHQPASPLLGHFATIDTTPGAAANIADALRFESISSRLGPALVLLQRRGLLAPVARLMARDETGVGQLRLLERVTLDLGLVDEQMQITGVLDA